MINLNHAQTDFHTEPHLILVDFMHQNKFHMFGEIQNLLIRKMLISI